jgi:hypothetical protein
MTMARTIHRPQRAPTTGELIKARDNFRAFKDMENKAKEGQKTYREILVAALTNQGYEDDKGSRWLDLGEGQDQPKYEKRVSVVFDAAAAEEWARTKGVWGKVSKTVEIMDEDALAALAWKDKALEAEVKQFYKENVVWALKV